jgi:MFS family permease
MVDTPSVIEQAPRPVPLTAFEKRFKHPPGLVVLFFAEMWERFSYYGMRGLLKLYVANYLFVSWRQIKQGQPFSHGEPIDVLGGTFFRSLLSTPSDVSLAQCLATATKNYPSLDPTAALDAARQACIAQEHASILYGWYTGLVYLTPFFGGIIADRYLGQRKTVLLGGTLMALGHFVMASEQAFFVALSLLILGNGAFKPNVSTQVGGLYAPGDPRRDGAFTIFYMGINLGAFICNFVCGTLAVVYGWHYGFAAAGVGMLLGLTVYVFGQRYLPGDRQPHAARDGRHDQAPARFRRVEEGRGVDRHLRAERGVLGRVRAAGQHHANVGRRADGVAGDRWLSNSHDLVSVGQPAVHRRAGAAARHVLAATGQARYGAVEREQDGHWFHHLGPLVHRDGGRGATRRRGQGQPVLAGVLHLALDRG